MKRLFLACAIMLTAAFSAQAIAQTRMINPPNEKGSQRTAQPHAAPSAQASLPGVPPGPGENPKEYAATWPGNMDPFLPKDTMVPKGWMVGKTCDKNGRFVSSGSSRCQVLTARSTGLIYMMRQSPQEGDSIFLLKNGNPELYVQFVGGRDVHRIVRQSPTAEQYAASHGYRFDASTSTMVASNAAAPQEMAAVDCSKQSADVILARRAGAKCIGESVAATKPAPTVAAAPQAKDCSQGSFIEREACKRGIGDVSTMIGTAIKK
jgi:hypothetical protein